MFTAITDHAARAVARLLTQFRSSAEARGVISAFAAEVQILEDAIVAAFVFRSIDGAADETLTRIGKLVGAAPRGTFTDTEYRIRIRVQILVNKSSGTAADLVAIAQTFRPEWNNSGNNRAHTREGGATVPVNRLAGIPTGELPSRGSVEICVISANGSSAIPLVEARELARYLKTAAGAGVRPVLKFRTFNALLPMFRMADPEGLLGLWGEPGAGFGVGKLASSLDH